MRGADRTPILPFQGVSAINSDALPFETLSQPFDMLVLCAWTKRHMPKNLNQNCMVTTRLIFVQVLRRIRANLRMDRATRVPNFKKSVTLAAENLRPHHTYVQLLLDRTCQWRWTVLTNT
jgi:hypothetical protein